jgi:hypothetical protein
VVALLAGIVGFEGLGHSNRGVEWPLLARARADRLPREITGAAPVVAGDPLAEPAFSHATVARHQLVLAAQVAAARVAADQLRSRAQVLSVVTPALAAGQRIDVTLSFYYCQDPPGRTPFGDGGGFCGAMADGSVVYPGAAACARRYLGQRFRILGDPLARTYTCADTGSAVHGLHRDIWFATSDAGRRWQRVVGQRGTIEILP